MRYKIFEHKNCFITGATGGMGSRIAEKMAENKCNLFLTSTSGAGLKALADTIRRAHGKGIDIFSEPGDLNKTGDIDRIIAAALKKMRSIDILVNCAGVFIVKPLSEYTLEDFESSFNLNVRAAFLFSRAFAPGMRKKRWGRIINIGSTSSYEGYKETSLYCASKHALLGFSRAVHDELKKDNIRTFCISPRGSKTAMGRLIKNQDFDTFIDPREIAEYAVFISSFDDAMISEEVRLNRMVVQ